ncbi:putative phosphoribosylaminoimidazole-succinocarboxamide synthase [Myriangium duriaei CBS 260.36]|uniref:Phosphoribosylaminoimidazole-succinocarboxamide synthase n=1 Tax=Myriangium duriaei CBS 260.36 TaxID=1168546 RepID=A0A9P4IV11_9PEZI|nr:putative phosphoribosylaminoimidazole-succinocarboxamide synthase [Myriangium duriaei CBS 260.36]
MSDRTAVTSIDSAVEQHGLKKIASGKVREIYDIDSKTLLFVATDRISAYDVIMKNGVPGKGSLLTLMTIHWFELFKTKIPELQTHLVSATVPQSLNLPDGLQAQLRHRSMVVRKLKVFPIESIVRGYITGSGWAEYKKSGTVHGIEMPTGLKESQKLDKPLWTPSTKAEVGDKDENITPQRAREIVGEKYAEQIEKYSIRAYEVARDYAAESGILLADTKFEWGLDQETDRIVLIDEVLTPDSSRFWPADRYEVGRGQDSYDKQFLRDWLTREGLKGKEGVEMPAEIVEKTASKYREAFEKLTGQKWEKALGSK